MFKKIIWPSYGSKDSLEVLKYVKYFAKNYNSQIICVYVKPDKFYEGVEFLEEEEQRLYFDWAEEISKEMEGKLHKISDDINNEGLKSSVKILEGTPHKEILNLAKKEKADLIAIGRGMDEENDEYVAPTTLKLIRTSDIPVLTAKTVQENINLKNILVPTTLYDLNSKDFHFALDLANSNNANIYHLYVIDTHNVSFPPELLTNMRGNAYNSIAENDINYKNVMPKVVEDDSLWKGIVNFSNTHDIDMIIMLSYSGKNVKKYEFLGSNAGKVILNSMCPVITIRP